MKKALSAVFAPRSIFWLLWLWVLYYVTLAMFKDEAFAGFVVAHKTNPVVLGISILTLIILTGAFLRYCLYGIKRNGKVFLLNLILPFGVLLFLAGFVFVSGFGISKFLFLQEGQEFRAPWNKEAFRVESVDVKVVENYFEKQQGVGILSREPKVEFSLGNKRKIIGAFPPTRMGGAYHHVLGFGISPGIELFENGKSVQKGNVNLMLLPPGAEDHIDIEGLPYRIYIRLAPEKIVEDGGEKIKLYDLFNPRFFIRVERGAELVFDGDSDQMVIFDEFALKFYQNTYWVWIKVVRGIGVPFVWAGFLFMLLGAPVSVVLLGIRLFRHSKIKD